MPLAPPTLSFLSLRQRRWLRRTAATLLALLALWLITWWAVPLLAQGPLERLASERLGRTVTVGAVEFKPWSLEVALRDVSVAGVSGAGSTGAVRGAPAQLTIARVDANVAWQSLLRLAPVVDALTVDAPVLRITHLGGSRYDVDDILARLAPPPNQPDTGPARMALYNIALNAGSIDFTDQAASKTHKVRGLTFTLPFISTLPSQREIKVEPHLSFALNGTPFDSSAQGTPFAQTGKGDAQLNLKGLDLAPYLAYLPASLPVKVQSALLDADIKIAFEQQPRIGIKLTGTVQAHKVRLTDRQGADLLSFARLKIDLADVRPLEQVIDLQQVELTDPVLSTTRSAAGQINLARLFVAGPSAPITPAASATPTSSTASNTSTPDNPPTVLAEAAATAPNETSTDKTRAPATAAKPWRVTVANAAVRGGTLRWADQTTRPAAALQATEVALEATGIALPFASDTPQPVAFKGGFAIEGGALRFAGEATDKKAQVNATATTLALQLAAPYLAQTLEPQLTGQLNGDIGVQWQAPTPDAAKAGATGITVMAGPLALDKLALQQGKATLASLDKLSITGAVVPLDARTATLDRLAISQPTITLERDAQGRWMFERWLKKAMPDTETDTDTEKAPATPTANTPPWKLRIAGFSLQDGAVSFSDQTPQRPVAMALSALTITARNLASDGSKPEAFALSARAAALGKGNTAGQLSYTGILALQPLATIGTLEATRLPLHALEGYLAGQLAIELLHADVGYRGQLAVAQIDKGPHPGLSMRVAGDAVIEEFKANSTAASTPKTAAQVGEELLAWKSLNLRGVSVATAPGTAPRIEVKETSVTDFFARITVNEAGRINLTDLAKTPAQASAANAASAAGTPPPATGASTANGAPAVSHMDADGPANATNATNAISATNPTTPANPLTPVIAFGPVSLVNGKVLFSDFFIKPNYSADLSELTGKLSAFSSIAPGGDAVMANLELRGRAEGSASLEVTGQLNPLAKPLALDITSKVTDLELPPLTPYAIKYAGHGIERGKLSMDVNYKVLPSGQLTASNRLVLNQLTFGEPVDGAPASLPVKLAVALLADRQGVIDLDLPISGSLNDPQFRLGPVIFKVIVNLIGKALTSPFSLLASALGGGDDMGSVPFAPGTATLAPSAQHNLAKIVKALTDRPALKITVTGMASLKNERDGLQRVHLQQRVLAEKSRVNAATALPVTRTGTAAGTATADTAVTPSSSDLLVSSAEYPALLKEVYRRADLPKPRTLLGLAKELTVPEMEALLLAQHPATDAMVAELAAQRGQAVRDYLRAQKLPADRIFVAAPKTGAQPDTWVPQAQMSLAAP
ncbi:MAG: DUF748 domain-containing protein [Burkholderiaceae bacterium]|nr:DUF748 domain-containing protein [Burkholderiaceae bacterium]